MAVRLLTLGLTIFILSGCSLFDKEPIITPPKKQDCLFPKMPIYKTPQSVPFEMKPKDLKDGTCIVLISDLLLQNTNNNILRRNDRNYKYTNIKINKEYHVTTPKN